MSAASNSSNHQPTAEEITRMKYDGRESRLSFRKFAEGRLRNDLKEEAIEICNPEIKTFAECSQEAGLMVVFTCKHLFQKVNECMSIHNGEEAWQRYKVENEDEIERKATLRPPP